MLPGRIKDQYLLFVLSISLLMAGNFFYISYYPHRFSQQSNYETFIKNDPMVWSVNQQNYRILVPFLVKPMVHVTSFFVSYNKAFAFSWLIFYIVASFIFLYSFFLYLKHWFNPEGGAIIGVLLAALLSIFTFRTMTFAPWSLLEPGLFTIGLILIHKKHFYWLIPLVIIATMNRSTSLFLIMAFFFSTFSFSENKYSQSIIILKTGLLGFIFLGTIGVIHYFRWLPANHTTSILEILRGNTTYVWNMSETIVNMSLFFLPLLVFLLPPRKFLLKKVPIFLKKVALIVPFYFLFFLCFGIWMEIRILMSLLPFVIPLAMYNRFGQHRP